MKLRSEETDEAICREPFGFGLALNNYCLHDDVFLIDQGLSRRIGTKQAWITRRFQEAFLSENTRAARRLLHSNHSW